MKKSEPKEEITLTANFRIIFSRFRYNSYFCKRNNS